MCSVQCIKDARMMFVVFMTHSYAYIIDDIPYVSTLQCTKTSLFCRTCIPLADNILALCIGYVLAG